MLIAICPFVPAPIIYIASIGFPANADDSPILVSNPKIDENAVATAIPSSFDFVLIPICLRSKPSIV